MRFDNSLSRSALLAGPRAALAAALVCALAAPTVARAQDEGEEPQAPIKRANPIIDKRALAIPGRLPDMKPVQKPGLPATPLAQTPPPVVTAPAPGAPGFAAQPGRPAEGDVTTMAGSGCRKMPRNDKVPFEFKDADIKDVVIAVSKMMCKNFIITSKVRSQKFDIVSPTKITVDEAWQAFLSALEANDFALFEVGKFSKIIQATDATRAPVEIYEDGRRVDPDDRMITRIWKIQHAPDVNAVVNYLNIFKSGKGQLHPFAATNTVIATDYASSIARLERILDEVDIAGGSERVHVVPVDHASATEVAEKLNQIFEPAKAAGQGKARGPTGALRTTTGQRSGAQVSISGDGVSVSKIIPDDRTNRLIIIGSDEGLKQILALKKKLDVPAEGAGEGQVHVLRLRHANAEELASTLGALAQGKPTSGRASRVSGGKPAAGTAPVPAPVPGGTAANSATLFSGEVKVTSDKPTNSLIITASKADFTSMKRVISSLDVARYQVYVEAAIMEVAVKRDRSFGISVHGGANPTIDNEDVPLIFTSQPSGMSSLASTLNPASLLSTPGISGLLRGPILPGSDTIVPGGIPAFGVLLQAVQGSNDVNIISTPQLLTMDNEEAEIQVSEKRPFSSGLSLGGLSGLGSLAGGGAGSALSSLAGLGGLGSVNITREDVGLTLKLKPQINDQQFVRLEIDQELSDVIGEDANTRQPITSKRAAKTVVVVRDQDSVVIGGLVRDRETESEGKTPLLGDIPLIGWLFKRQTKQFEKVNLILVITPYIIRGPEDFYKIYERKMKERREFVERFYGDSPDFRATVDWDRKPGPLAQYRQELRDEMSKAENGGPGAEGETVVTPETEVQGEAVDIPDGETPSITPPPSGETAPVPGDVPPPPMMEGGEP